MKKISCFSIILLLVMCLMPLNVVADNTAGDVNNDGEVNIADVNTVINFILGDRSRHGVDVNNDGEVNIADVNAIIGIILKGTSATEEHEYVDLGLPSGTLWATCNVGASAPEEYGDYFAWGEIEPKTSYTNENHKWEDEYRFIKYNFDDNMTELDLEDDAAYMNWGSSWRMPSREQIDELLHSVVDEYVQRNGVNGILLTGPNGNTLFLPAAGCNYYQSLSVGKCGYYWSRTLGPKETGIGSAHILAFSDIGATLATPQWLRPSGNTIRAVRVSQN